MVLDDVSVPNLGLMSVKRRLKVRSRNTIYVSMPNLGLMSVKRRRCKKCWVGAFIA